MRSTTKGLDRCCLIHECSAFFKIQNTHYSLVKALALFFGHIASRAIRAALPALHDSAPDMEGQIDLHLLPANIAYSGSIPQVDTYFRAKDTGTCVDGLPLKEAVFRGHRLAGTTVSLPEGFSGMLLKKNNTDNKDSDKEWDTAGTFSQLSSWNHETAPTKTDGLNRCNEWLQVAKQIHAPVTAGEMEQQM